MAAPETPSKLYRKTPRFKREARALGARVRAMRHAAGWTLEEAAERCHLDWKHLQKVEAGSLNLTLVSLVRLSEGFRQPLHAFFAPPDQGKWGPSTRRARPPSST